MARRLRYGLAGRLVEITCRTLQGRFLVRPSSFVNVAVKGTLGRAQRYYGLRICAAVFLSNHYHLLVVPESEEQLKAFMRFLNSNLARQLGRLHDWPEKMWPQGYKAIPISDEPEAQMAKLRYVLEHGVKENLVEKPGDWPGVQCVHELRTGARFLGGMWHERTLEYEVRRSGAGADHDFKRRDFWTPEKTELSPPPFLADADSDERRRFFKRLIREIEVEWRDRRKETGKKVLGKKRILQQDPHTRPEHMKRSRAPLVHAKSPEVRHQMIEEYRAFVALYRAAAEQLRAGLPAVFPPGCFPPPGPYMPRDRAGPGPASA